LLAAEEIAKHRTSHAVKSLALTAMTDRYRSVRDCCLTSLKTIDDPETPENFVPFLRSKSPEERVNAANALSIFPSRKAVPELIETLHLTWAGFGGGFIFQGEQRAYVGDYELVSGGTGFSIVEVADPVIQTSTTGVALDADVRRVEMYARLRTMKKITGQEFGADVEKWREWWKKNQDSE
jgi:hypothetical protein